MNDPSQTEYHKVNVVFLITNTEDGYQAACPHCPWTSGIRQTKELAMKAYYRHLGYIMNKLGE